jgi:hypothetical protein
MGEQRDMAWTCRDPRVVGLRRGVLDATPDFQEVGCICQIFALGEVM